MPNKHPSSTSVALVIALIVIVASGLAYGLGVMNMKKADPATETVIEQTADSAIEPGHDHDHDHEHATNTKAPKPASGDLLSAQPDDIVFGRKDAPVTIIEYSSLSCPHCANFHNEEFSKLETRYIDTGTAKLVVRPFPLNAPALKGALLVDCVDAPEKQKFLKVLFAMQRQWAFSESYISSLQQIAAVGGVSNEAFDTCMKDKAREDAIIAKVEKASESLAIQSTPTFFINGTKWTGTPSANAMGAAIEKAAKAK